MNVEIVRGRKPGVKSEKENEAPSLKALLYDTEIADFFKFVAKNDLRIQAFNKLKEKISNMR